MTDTNFQEMLNRITPEYRLETQKVLRYIQDELADTKVPAPDGPQDLTEEQRTVVTAALLIAYGEQKKSPASAPTQTGQAATIHHDKRA